MSGTGTPPMHPIAVICTRSFRVALLLLVALLDGAVAAEVDASSSSDLVLQYRRDVTNWPPFAVDDGVEVRELGELPPLPAEPWHTPSAEALGKLLFFDPRLSGSGQIACASCHDPELGWADGRRFPFGHDRSSGRRNAMTLLNVGYFGRWSWDGRAASLNAQALRAIRSPIEMNADVGTVIDRLKRIDAFFVPTDSMGWTARLEGAFIREELSKRDVDHLVGEGATLDARPDGTAGQISFVARAVELRESPAIDQTHEDG